MMIYVPLAQIEDNPFQRRQEYGDIAELAADIYRHQPTRPDTLGLQQVPSGRIVDEDGTLVPVAGLDEAEWLDGRQLRRGWLVQLEFGHRRYRAFQHLFANSSLAEYHQMPVIIRDLTDDQMLDGVWSENRARRDLSAVEEAELLRAKLARLQAAGGGSQQALADAWGLARSTVANRLRLLELPADIQAANRCGQLSERQCLALAPVLKIGELVDGRADWGNHIGDGWGAPASAETVVAEAIKRPDSVTSDVIRAHARKMLDYAGSKIPDCIARHKFDELGGIEQPQCKGCRYRMDQYCLDAACLGAKKEAWPEIALAQFSAETGIPISDRDEDFYAADRAARQRIRTLYEAEERGGGMVCGWRVGVMAARLGDYSHYVASRLALGDSNGRAGLALGYRGRLPEEETAEAASAYDLPPADLREAWQQQASEIRAAARQRLLEAMADVLWRTDMMTLDLLQAAIRSPSGEWLDGAAELTAYLVEWLLERGYGVGGYDVDHHHAIEKRQALANRAGLGVSLLGGPVERLRQRAVLILGCWYGNHNRYWWQDDAERAADRIAAWLQDSESVADQVAEERGWLLQAQRYIEQRLAAEGEDDE